VQLARLETWWLKPFCIGLGAARNTCYTRVLQCKTFPCNAIAPRHWVKSLQWSEDSPPHPCMCAGLRIPHLLVLSMAQFRLISHTFGVELGRHQGVVWFARGCKRCAALGRHDLPEDGRAQLLFLCPATVVVSRERRLHNNVIAGYHVLSRCLRGGTIRAQVHEDFGSNLE
jgi:hypothetical protein